MNTDSEHAPTDARSTLVRDRRLARACLLVVLLYAAIASVDRAARRPFWFDEILTVAVSTQPSVPEIWRALGSGLDHNPPLFHLIEHAAAKLPFDRHVALRLPSIAAFCLTVVALFIFVSRAVSDPVAGAAAAVIALTTQLFTLYAVEARPYALIGCAAAWAIVMWQRADDGSRFAAGCGLLLSSATSLHYYAVLAVLPLVAGELTRWVRTRQFRLVVWLSFVAGVVPIAVFWPLMSRIRGDFAAHFWARPPLVGFLRPYDAFLNMSNWWGVAVSCTVGAALLLTVIQKLRSRNHAGPPFLEAQTLVLGLLCLPPLAYAAAGIVGVGVTGRYLIPTSIGIIVAVSFIGAKNRRATLLIGALATCVVVVRGLEDTYTRGSLAEQSAAREHAALVNVVVNSGHGDLPIAISNGLAYLPMAFYGGGGKTDFVYLSDSRAAVRHAGTDTTELLLQRAAPLMSLDVNGLAEFTAAHDRFLVYGGSEMWDWLPAELSAMGFRLESAGRAGPNTLYLAQRRRAP